MRKKSHKLYGRALATRRGQAGENGARKLRKIGDKKPIYVYLRVLRHEIDYKTPACLGDEVIIQTWVGEATGLAFERHTHVLRSSDMQLLAQARTVWCPISTKTGRPQRVSVSLRSQFSTNL